MNFTEELHAMRKQAASQRTPEAMATGYFDSVMEVKKPQSAAQMEKLIVEFMRLKGHQAQKVTTTGTYRDNRKVVKDALGFNRQIGSAQWTKGTATKGAADIKCTIAPAGISLAIEVKFSKSDRQRPEQKQYQSAIEAAGGFYMIARTLDEFHENYYKIMDHPKIKMLNSL
jgi:hypothetical protein